MALIDRERDPDEVLRIEDEAIRAADDDTEQTTALHELARLLDGDTQEVHGE